MRIDAYRARIVSAISRIVSPCLHTVRPKFADTKFCRSLSLWCPFLVSQWADWYFQENCLQTVIAVIQVELPHFSNRDLYLLPVLTLIFTQMSMRPKTWKGTSIGNPNVHIVMKSILCSETGKAACNRCVNGENQHNPIACIEIQLGSQFANLCVPSFNAHNEILIFCQFANWKKMSPWQCLYRNQSDQNGSFF